MKLVGKNITEKDGSGSITIIPLDPEDLWHVFQLLSVGDRLRMKTERRVQKESVTGQFDNERKLITLTIQIKSVKFEPGSQEIRVSGRNAEENKFVKLGGHHTHTIIFNKKATIIKEVWDQVSLERLDEACNPVRSADTGIVIMEEGLAHICLLTQNLTIVRGTVDLTIPGKRKGRETGHAKAYNKFFEAVLQGVLRHFDFKIVKCIILASPGFVKDKFFDYLKAEATRRELRELSDNIGKFILCHASSGHKHSIKEVLANPQVVSQLADTKVAAEVKTLKEFFKTLSEDEHRATYGKRQVFRAAEAKAIQHLLLVDDIFRKCDVKERKQFIELMDSVKESGGEVRVFSAQHVSGESLSKFSGIAAILHFPFPDEREEDIESEENLSFLDDDEDEFVINCPDEFE